MDNKYGIEIKTSEYNNGADIECYVNLAPILNDVFGANIVEDAECWLEYTSSAKFDDGMLCAETYLDNIISDYEKCGSIDFDDNIVMKLSNGRTMKFHSPEEEVSVSIEKEVIS